MLAAAFAIAPLLTRYLPDLIGWLGGDRAEEVASDVLTVVRGVTGGSTDPADIAAINADPARSADLALGLARIAADREKARNEALLAEMKAALADTADARKQTVALAQVGSPIAYGAAMVSAVVLALFSLMVVAEQFGWPAVGDGTKRLVEAALILVLGYWVGSSAGSAAKDSRQAAAASALASVAQDVAQARSAAAPAAARRLFGGTRP